MITIIGFGEVVLLTGEMASKKEMRVRTPDGHEHGVEVPESVVSRLLSIWVDYKKNPTATRAPTQAPVLTPVPALVATGAPAEDPAPDVGEVTFGGDLPAVAKPVVTRPAVPGFMAGGDDDDGAQI